jgi:hypothetical protein
LSDLALPAFNRNPPFPATTTQSGAAQRAEPGRHVIDWRGHLTLSSHGPAAAIYPMVYHDLVRWIEERGYTPIPPGRDVWINAIDDIADVEQQVFETRLAFTRPPGTSES